MDEKYVNQPYLVLMETTKAIQERIRGEMIKHKLNVTEFSVLEILYIKRKQTIRQIGNSILVSSGSMTYIIDKLEQKGLLNRHACHKDRRVIHVMLTDDGNHLMKKIIPNYRDLVNYIFGSLNEEESQKLVSILKKVNGRVEP